MRTPHGLFPQYHSSADNLDFVQPVPLADSFAKCVKIFDIIENNGVYVNQNPKGEPQLGKRGLYYPLGSRHTPPIEQLALLWVLNLSDGNHSLLDIADRADMDFDTVRKATNALVAEGLLQKV
jgi:aminopeptidase-like protein